MMPDDGRFRKHRRIPLQNGFFFNLGGSGVEYSHALPQNLRRAKEAGSTTMPFGRSSIPGAPITFGKGEGTTGNFAIRSGPRAVYF